MPEDEDARPQPPRREIVMAARATIELFGNGAAAKTRERLAEVEADGGEEATIFWREMLEEVERLHELRHTY